jgi:hypothetical protein
MHRVVLDVPTDHDATETPQCDRQRRGSACINRRQRTRKQDHLDRGPPASARRAKIPPPLAEGDDPFSERVAITGEQRREGQGLVDRENDRCKLQLLFGYEEVVHQGSVDGSVAGDGPRQCRGLGVIGEGAARRTRGVFAAAAGSGSSFRACSMVDGVRAIHGVRRRSVAAASAMAAAAEPATTMRSTVAVESQPLGRVSASTA